MNHAPRLFALALLTILVYQPILQAQSTSEPAPDLKVIGVLMHADWCPDCKMLAPKMEQVQRSFADQGILFTVFDMTDDYALSQSQKFAKLLGLSDLFKAYAGRTGYVVLLNAQTHEALGTLRFDHSEEELRQLIATALARV